MPDESVGSVELELRRDLTFFDITMIGIGAMIGAGIFVLTGYAINGAGPAAIVVFLLNGIVAFMTALTYMELGSCFPEAGGGYLWVREGMPHPFGFLSGWMSWMAHTVACSLYALGFGSYLTWAFEAYDVSFYFIPYDVVAKVFAVVVAIVLLSINYIGTGTAGKTENIATIAKLITLFIFVGFGVYALVTNPWAVDNFTKDFLPNGFGGIAYGMGLTFIAFQGFEVIAQCGEEVKDPRKNIPKAILVSLIVVVIIYIGVVVVLIGAVNGDEPGKSWEVIGAHGEMAIVEAAKVFMGPIGFLVMIVGGLVSTVSALNATVFSSSRVSFAMGRDGTLPESLGRIHKIRRTPSNAIMVTGVIMIIMAVTLPIEDVAASADIMFLLLFSFANISLITLRRKMPYLQRGFVVPFVPVIPVMATVLNLLLAVYLFKHSPVSWYIAIAWMEIGLLSYYFTRGKEEIREIDKVEKLIGVPRRETGKNYHVLVPIANPKNTELIDFASTVARQQDGDMILLNIVRIPDNLPIQNVGYDFVKKRVATAETLSEYSNTKHNLQTRARVVVSHKIRDTILDTVNKEKANITIIGWSGKPPRSRLMFGYNIDDIIQFAKSDVAVLKGPMKTDLKRILVVPGYGLHARRTAEIASYLARDSGAVVTIVGLLTPDKTETEVRDETKQISDVCRHFGVAVEENIIRTKRPVGKIISLSKEFDFMLIGASEKWKLLRFAFGPIPDSLARKATIPLLMLRAYEKEEKMLSTSKLGEEDEDKKRAKQRPARESIQVPYPIPRPVVADEKTDDGGTGEPEAEASDTEDEPESSTAQAMPAQAPAPVPVSDPSDEKYKTEQSPSTEQGGDETDDWTDASKDNRVNLGKADKTLESSIVIESDITAVEEAALLEAGLSDTLDSQDPELDNDTTEPNVDIDDPSIPDELKDDEIDLLQEAEEVDGIEQYLNDANSLLENGNGSRNKQRNHLRGGKRD